MEYEDLKRMYWCINKLFNTLNNIDEIIVSEECESDANWCLATIDEELRQLEMNNEV